MTDTAEHLQTSPASLERRQYPRRKVSDICYVVFLDGVNGGLVLNISETGLLLQAALQVTSEEASRLRFQLPSSDQWIEAKAKLVWVAESGKEAGAQFLDLPARTQKRIKEWVANRDLSPSPAGVPVDQHVQQPTTVESSSPENLNPAADSPNAAAASRPAVRPEQETVLPLRGLAIVLCLVAVAAAVLLGFRYSRQLSQLPVLAKYREARNILVSADKTVRSLYTSAVTRIAGGHQQSPRLPLNAAPGGATPSGSAGHQPLPPASPPKSAQPELGSMVTQTLSPAPAVQAPTADAIRSRSRAQRRTLRGSQSSSARPQPLTRTRESSSNVALVAAPAVGEPPARVIFERVPVSATSSVAVTERRSILVAGSHDPMEKLQLGKLVSHVDPFYPFAAMAKNTEGTVRVRAFVGPSGEVLNVRLLSGPAVLAPAAMNAIRKWRYDPTLLNGQAIKSQADVTIYFRLH